MANTGPQPVTTPSRRPASWIPGADPEQVAFELHAFMVLGNLQHVATAEPACLERGRHAVDARLRALAV